MRIPVKSNPPAKAARHSQPTGAGRPRVGWRRGVLRFVALLGFAVGPPGRAVVFLSSGDPNYNTTAPTGPLAGSGWQWTGNWGGFQGAPIGPHHFLAARHVGGNVGDEFILNGVHYQATAYTDDPLSDLRVWTTRETFPSWAPLLRAPVETGRGLVVFGRGMIRGAEVRANNVLKGWQWAASDGKLRWGQNTVVGYVNAGRNWGELALALFDQAGGPNEASLATGDSSAPVFMNDGTGWKLAGVAATVIGPFNTTNSGDGFPASIFDGRGLYYTSTPPTGWTLLGGPRPIPAGFFFTRVSVRAAWIDRIVLAAEPAAGGPAGPSRF
jgi:hypothetical protein